MKIKLTNKTRYRDDDLRAIVRLACKQAGVACPALILKVVSARDRVSGRASIPRARSLLARGWMLMRIPPLAKKLEAVLPTEVVAKRHKERAQSFARVALHEAMHLAGVQHKDMTDDQLYCRMQVPWADGLELREQEMAAVLPVEERRAAARADRAEHARGMLRKAETRAKRANTILKKWKRRVARLEGEK